MADSFWARGPGLTTVTAGIVVVVVAVAGVGVGRGAGTAGVAEAAGAGSGLTEDDIGSCSAGDVDAVLLST